MTRTLQPELECAARNQRHELLISWLRGLAALQVAAAHLRAEIFPGYASITHPSLAYQGIAFVTGFAHQAVMVFFVLSGWLVGGTYLARQTQPNAMRDYAVDRVTRLWTVLLPAMLLTLLLAWLADPVWASKRSDPEFAWSTLAGNLVGLQTLVLPNYGHNFPLWSLANETWYYALFPLIVYIWRADGHWKRGAVLLAAAAIVLVMDGIMLAYFTLWLLGVLAARWRVTLSAVARVTVGLGALAAAVYCRLSGNNDDLSYTTFPQDLAFGALFAWWLSAKRAALTGSWPTKRWLERGGTWLAGFSFSLYVIHIPVMNAMLPTWRASLGTTLLSPSDPLHLLVYAVMILLLVVAAWMFSLAFEAHTMRVRRALKGWLNRAGIHAPQPPAPIH